MNLKSQFPVTSPDRLMEVGNNDIRGMTFKALQFFILVTRKVSLFIPPPAVLRVFDSVYWFGITVFKMVTGVMEDRLCIGFWSSVKYFMSP